MQDEVIAQHAMEFFAQIASGKLLFILYSCSSVFSLFFFFSMHNAYLNCVLVFGLRRHRPSIKLHIRAQPKSRRSPKPFDKFTMSSDPTADKSNGACMALCEYYWSPYLACWPVCRPVSLTNQTHVTVVLVIFFFLTHTESRPIIWNRNECNRTAIVVAIIEMICNSFYFCWAHCVCVCRVSCVVREKFFDDFLCWRADKRSLAAHCTHSQWSVLNAMCAVRCAMCNVHGYTAVGQRREEMHARNSSPHLVIVHFVRYQITLVCLG